MLNCNTILHKLISITGSELTRLLDSRGGIGDGLLGPISDSVGRTRGRPWREAARRGAPGGSSNPLISVITRPSLPFPIFRCSTGALADNSRHITAVELTCMYYNTWITFSSTTYEQDILKAPNWEQKTCHLDTLTNFNMFQSKT